jgi:hypothetical protein
MSADKFLWHMEKGYRDRVIERIEEEKKNEPPTTIKAAHERFIGKRGHKNHGKGAGRFGRST